MLFRIFFLRDGLLLVDLKLLVPLLSVSSLSFCSFLGFLRAHFVKRPDVGGEGGLLICPSLSLLFYSSNLFVYLKQLFDKRKPNERERTKRIYENKVRVNKIIPNDKIALKYSF